MIRNPPLDSRELSTSMSATALVFPSIPESQQQFDRWLTAAMNGDQAALASLFESQRDRLARMIHLRMDHRLRGRFDPADVLQETFLDVARRIASYAQNAEMPFFLWLRFLAHQRLIDLHRQHLGASMRTVQQEVSLDCGDFLVASSDSIAEAFASRLTSASHAAIRAELQQQVHAALAAMEPLDREILALRHYELLTNEESAAVLGLKKSAASNRYVRALRRLKDLLGDAVWDQIQ